jgi:protein-S-isoprenylcysteine O-methyltransferase Ste14
MRERIEKRQVTLDGTQHKFRARLPFLFSCSCLYGALVMPAYVSLLLAQHGPSMPCLLIPKMLYQTCLSLSLLFFLLGAVGDIHKSIAKAYFGSQHLVTGGLYRFIRHPNYSFEMLAWMASSMASIWAILARGPLLSFSLWKKIAIPLLLGFVGTLGISFILSAATFSLEIRQAQKYGALESYKTWIHSSWAGLCFSPDTQ